MLTSPPTTHPALAPPATRSPVISHNGEAPKTHKGEYQTDFLADRAEAFIDAAAAAGKPFYVHISTTAPHQLGTNGAPIPADRHATMFADERAPELPNYNEHDNFDKPANLRLNAPLMPNDKKKMDKIHVARWRSLQAVDEMVERIVLKLQAAGQLDNTYIMYTSDNGYHLGSHRWASLLL